MIAVLVWAIVSLLWKKYRYGKNEGDTWTTFASRSALTILPLALITGAYGALVSAFGLYAATKLTEYSWMKADNPAFTINEFGIVFCRTVHYNVAYMEFINGTTQLFVGLVLVLGILACLVASAFPKTRSWRVGRRAQDAVVVFLWSVFAGFFVVLGALVFARQPQNGDPCGQLPIIADLIPGSSLMAIYTASSLRVVPWLGLAVGPLQTVTNIVADVLCYVLPQAFPLSIAKAAKERVETLLRNINLADTIVLAHSQGSVVAHAVLSKMKANGPLLITAGSPLWSLYRRFLNVMPWSLEGISKWINVYRLSDFVGGEVTIPGVDNYIIDSNYELTHFGYFEGLSDMLQVTVEQPSMLFGFELTSKL
jgi:hypothetical protein